jgi:hypothetical protein
MTFPSKPLTSEVSARRRFQTVWRRRIAQLVTAVLGSMALAFWHDGVHGRTGQRRLEVGGHPRGVQEDQEGPEVHQGQKIIGGCRSSAIRTTTFGIGPGRLPT